VRFAIGGAPAREATYESAWRRSRHADRSRRSRGRSGETALTGFSRLWKPWGVLFIVFALCQNFWPGWATGAATTLTFAVGGGDVVTITVLALISIGLALTASPVVYQTVEKAMGLMVVAIMAFVVIAVVLATDGGSWGDFATSFTAPEIPSAGT